MFIWAFFLCKELIFFPKKNSKKIFICWYLLPYNILMDIRNEIMGAFFKLSVLNLCPFIRFSKLCIPLDKCWGLFWVSEVWVYLYRGSKSQRRRPHQVLSGWRLARWTWRSQTACWWPPMSPNRKVRTLGVLLNIIFQLCIVSYDLWLHFTLTLLY